MDASRPPPPPVQQDRVQEEWVRLSCGAPVPALETVRVVAPLAEVLAGCQRRGVVHCDVKPDNVLLDLGPDGGAPPRIRTASSASRTGSGAADSSRAGYCLRRGLLRLPHGRRRGFLRLPHGRRHGLLRLPRGLVLHMGRGSQRLEFDEAMHIGERMRGFTLPLSSSRKMRYGIRSLLELLQ